MKRIPLVFLLILFCLEGRSQGYFQRLETKERKYFVDAGYGLGTARWFSRIEESSLYQPTGNLLKTGNIKFRAKNNTASYHFAIMVPVKKIRLGLGICFEDFYLDKLEISSDNAIKDSRNLLLFDEDFQFQKMFTQIEVPFNFESESKFSLNFNGHLGYYSFSGLGRMNFFGVSPLAQTFFMTAGIVADYKFYPHTYLFVYPNIEGKYFNNSRLELPSNIIHRIITGTVVAGVRIDMSKE